MAHCLLLVRHGDTGPQYRGRFVGRTDVPLSERGERQAATLASVVHGLGTTRCFCSPLMRAVRTAGLACLKAVVWDDLREVDFGRWEGRTFEEVQAADPELVARWAEWPADFAFPGGERIGDFLARVRQAADRMASDPAEVVVAVTHGGVIRAMACHLLGLDARQYVLFNVEPASVTRVDLFDGKGVLAGLNDTCHLRAM